MIGLIVTGHGNFATGMTEALNLIAGAPDHYRAVDFTIDMSTDDLDAKLKQAMADLSGCEGILFLCDLAGGSPFKEAVLLGLGADAEIVAGTNLGMLLEVNLTRQFSDDVHALADSALTVGKDQVQKFEVKEMPKSDEEEDDFEDGI